MITPLCNKLLFNVYKNGIFLKSYANLFLFLRKSSIERINTHALYFRTKMIRKNKHKQCKPMLSPVLLYKIRVSKGLIYMVVLSGCIKRSNTTLWTSITTICQYILKEAIDWMCSHTDIFHDGIGVHGASRGGMIALLMAAHSPKV